MESRSLSRRSAQRLWRLPHSAQFAGRRKDRNAYAGAVVDGWIAPALDQANPSPLPWTEEDLFSFLRTGTSPMHGAAGGTMTPVIRDALALAVVPDSDVRAIAVYFSD